MSEKEIFKWYLFRIAYRKEKKVKDILDIADIENFIPFTNTEFLWNGSLKVVEIPVCPGIGFARVGAFDLEMLKMMPEISLIMDANQNLLTFSEERIQHIRENPSSFPGNITENENY